MATLLGASAQSHPSFSILPSTQCTGVSWGHLHNLLKPFPANHMSIHVCQTGSWYSYYACWHYNLPAYILNLFTGTINQANVDIASNDYGGKMGPHGADRVH